MSLRVNGCCRMSLRVAGLVIGWLDILYLVIGIIYMSTRIIFFDPNEKPPINRYPFTIGKTLPGAISWLIFYLFDAVITGLLLAGIYKNKHNLVLPWLVVRALGLIVTIGTVVLFLVSAPFSTGAEVIGTISAAFISAITFCLFVWCWIVIYSLFHEIRNSVKNPSQRERGMTYAY